MNKIKHGDEMQCSTCGFPGRYDCAEVNEGEVNYAVFNDSIWFNSHKGPNGGWECVECWLK